jgi:amino acid transporter
MEFMNPLTFASDAALLAVTGAVCWVLAVVCMLMDRLREKRRSVDRLERVGFVPWTALFLGLAIIGGGCLAMSLPVVLGNL